MTEEKNITTIEINLSERERERERHTEREMVIVIKKLSSHDCLKC